MHYKLEIFAPQASVANIRDALHRAGAGVVGDYDHVVALTAITGSWRPLENAHPVSGEVGIINFGEEVKMEVRCHESCVQKVLNAVRDVHPYEEPVINILPLHNHLFD